MYSNLHSVSDSVESESYVCDETANQYMYPGGYVDPTGVYYMNNGYEMYDPYTGTVTVIVGPGPQYGNGPQVLTAVPCAPLPLQPLEWFNPAASQPPFLPPAYHHRKKRSSIDSQNCSGQSSETTCNPGSPPEPMDGIPDPNSAPFYPAQYVYPGAYMFGAPLYNMNGVSVQGLVPPCAPPPADQAKRRKKRRRRRRGGAVTDEGSESSCEEVMSCEAGNESQSGASSDTALGSSSSKTNSDSGIHTDPTANSGSDSPQILESNYFYPMSPTENLVEPANASGSLVQVPSELEAHSEVVAESPDNSNEVVIETTKTVEVIEESHIESLPCEDSTELDQRCDDHQQNDETLPEPLVCVEQTQQLNEELPLADIQEEIIDEIQLDVVANDAASLDKAYLQDACITSSTIDDILEVKAEIASEEEQCTSDFMSSPTSPQTPAEDYYTSDETEPTPVSPLSDSLRVLSDPDLPCQVEEVVENGFYDEVCPVSSADDDQHLMKDDDKVDLKDTSIVMEEVCTKLMDTSVVIDEVCTKLEESHLYEEPEVMRSDTEEMLKVCNEEELSHHCELYGESEAIPEIIAENIKEESPFEVVEKPAERPITRAVTKWLETQGSLALSGASQASLGTPESTQTISKPGTSSNDDEIIEEGEDPLTGQKNGEGNPFLASSPSDAGTRVAEKDLGLTSVESWDLEREARMRAMCDPKASVNKYYRLAAESTSPDKSPVAKKTAVHIGRAGPFPCGICCILQ
ncbi:hypothetical protein GE061_003920 [Apolygus lucorum]|uniref:Uncharacterized protein n=1 Tax=Apolygus lucorum TaxID=248454 RepID=A0A8S9WZ88_APOLU|nr:hypothetical protein GE061_003920 [Apolygus lucorum]